MKKYFALIGAAGLIVALSAAAMAQDWTKGFKSHGTNWGESSYTAGEFGSGSANRMGVASADQVQLEIKHAYVDFVIPNTPLSVTAGIQGFAYEIGRAHV